jgi:hypothetical protein
MISEEEDRIMVQTPGPAAEQDVFLLIFKGLVDKAEQRLQENCPDLAKIVREMERGR